MVRIMPRKILILFGLLIVEKVCCSALPSSFSQDQQESVITRTEVAITNNSNKKIATTMGQKLKLPCNYSTDPNNRITNFFWMKNDQILDPSTDDFDHGYDGSLTILNVQKKHEGSYKCTVVTVIDQASDQVEINVLAKAPVNFKNYLYIYENSQVTVIRRTKVVITNNSNKEITTTIGKKLKLPCNYSTDPNNRITKLFWTKNGQTLEASAGFDHGFDGSLTIPNVQKQHEGSYMCTVVTVMDQASDQVEVNVLEEAPVIIRYTQYIDRIIDDQTADFMDWAMDKVENSDECCIKCEALDKTYTVFIFHMDRHYCGCYAPKEGLQVLTKVPDLEDRIWIAHPVSGICDTRAPPEEVTEPEDLA